MDHRKFKPTHDEIDLKESPKKKKVDINTETDLSSVGTKTDLKALTESLKHVSRFAKDPSCGLMPEKLGIFSFFRRFYTI